MHLWLSLPTGIENGAVRMIQQDKEIVLTDGGYEVRNTRWSGPLRSWQVAYNNADLTSDDHAAVEQMWRDTNGGTDTFKWSDERTGDTARVRFDAELQFTNTVGPFYHLDTFTLREVRDTSPEPTAIPAISGTATVGNDLTVSDGTWSGSPTSFAYQWLSDGDEIVGETADTYTLVTGDTGAMIGCAVVATDAFGGQTKVWAVEVGPIA
jgi:hypothetical protein